MRSVYDDRISNIEYRQRSNAYVRDPGRGWVRGGAGVCIETRGARAGRYGDGGNKAGHRHGLVRARARATPRETLTERKRDCDRPAVLGRAGQDDLRRVARSSRRRRPTILPRHFFNTASTFARDTGRAASTSSAPARGTCARADIAAGEKFRTWWRRVSLYVLYRRPCARTLTRARTRTCRRRGCFLFAAAATQLDR